MKYAMYAKTKTSENKQRTILTDGTARLSVRPF